MSIRTKLLLAMMIPLGLLMAQLLSVNVFIRELQDAVAFIASAHTVIETNFTAAELVATLRQEVKKLPSRHVSAQGKTASGPDPVQTAWQALTVPIDTVRHSSAARRITPDVLEAVTQAFDKATRKYEQTQSVIASGKTDLDTLLERAIIIDKALVVLGEALGTLTRELRRQLQVAVEREQQIHNRPRQAGLAIGGLAIVLLAVFAWLFAALFVKPLRHMTAVVTTMAARDIDLEKRMHVASKDEIGTLASGFNMMLQHLAGLVRQVQQAGIQVTSSATQLAASGKQLESMMTQQVASTHEVVTTTQEIAVTSQELARTMQDVTTVADQTAVATLDIERIVHEMRASVRAGVMSMEQFAHEVHQGVEQVRTVGEQLGQIIAQVQALTPRFDTVNQGMQTQAQGAQQISAAMAQLSETAQQTAASLYTSNQAIAQLNVAAQGLHDEITRFHNGQV
jgi:methyl-accepting chemotaxis protein